MIEEVKANHPRREQAAGFAAAVMAADTWDFGSLGSSLGSLYLADGRVSGYGGFQATALHCAAGVLLAREAGAVVSDIQGQPSSIESDSLLAAAGDALHEDLLARARAAQGLPALRYTR